MSNEFNEKFFAWSMAMSGKPNASEYEKGDKIILPQQVILNIKPSEDGSPLYFRLTNEEQRLAMHVGVLEFTALDGNCHLPFWIMSQLLLGEGSPVSVQLVSDIKPASAIKLKPQDKNFTDKMSDPKAVLENRLRKYTCLTKGTWICINYLDENHYFDVVDTQPEPVVSLINTDCNLEFELPPQPKKESKKLKSNRPKLTPIVTKGHTEFKPVTKLDRFPGKGRRLGSE